MITRREFLYGSLATMAVRPHRAFSADCTLRIGNLSHEVAPGFVYKTTAYNGQAPAPVVRLHQGVPATVDIFNETSFDEYVHWHGFEIPSAIDGTQEEESHIVRAHSRLQYAFTPRQAGARWVHSHSMSHPKLDRGVYSGQYAMVYVEPRDNPGSYDREFFLTAHEWGAEMRWLRDANEEEEENPIAVPSGGSWEVQYDIGSINGKALGHGEPLRVREGERVLLHILNASATVMQRFALAGHMFCVVALDGNPVPHPRKVEVLDLGVGERISALVEMRNPGVWVLGSIRDSDREDGRMGIVVEYAGRSGRPQWETPLLQPWDYALFAEAAPQPTLTPEQVLPMIIDRGVPSADRMETWTINGATYNGTPTLLQAGVRYRLAFQNRTEEDHPLHLHRYGFELTRIHGRPVAGVWKDVVVLKRYERLEVDFTPEDKGAALFHCHHQMHMDGGFKKLFKII